jgi:peptidoglycan/LPS O-acetylase OafA/YrhL
MLDDSTAIQSTEVHLRQERARYTSIDGIRGWMSFVVLLHHCYLFMVFPILGYDSPWMRFVTSGHFAVLVFFVLSGFVLSITFIDKGDPATIWHLALRRYFRLVIPIFCSCAVAYVLMKLGLMASTRAALVTHDAVWLGSFYSFDPSVVGLLRFSFLDVFVQYPPTGTYNSNLWTMSAELIGSFIVFASLLILPKRYLLIPQIVLTTVFFYLNSNFFCFSCGVLLAYFAAWINREPLSEKRAKLISKVTIAAIIAVIVSVGYTTMRPALPDFVSIHVGAESVSMAMAVLFVFGCVNARFIRAFFESRISKFMGDISFPLYLVQIPILCSFSSLFFLKLVNSQVSPSTACLWTVAFTIAANFLGAIAFLPIERAAIALSRRFSIWFFARHSAPPTAQKSPPVSTLS